MQGIVYRKADPRFAGRDVPDAVRAALADEQCILVNRNRGSGTRILIDQLLGGAKPPGYSVEARSHNAVAAAVAQERADWGVAISTVAREADLGFLLLQVEHYDFVVPHARLDRPALLAFIDVLGQPETRAALLGMGFHVA
jgi:putative molybdopterin biosynthesis protein